MIMMNIIIIIIIKTPLTSKLSSHNPTIQPSQESSPLKNASIDVKAINITPMLATKPIDIDAPTANASNIFFSSLCRLLFMVCGWLKEKEKCFFIYFKIFTHDCFFNYN